MTDGAGARDEIERLIAQTALGDRGAFRQLYSRTSAKLFSVCLRVLDNRAEAEEALQEVYIRIWNKAGAYQVNGLSPMTWLITVARNIAVDRRRRRKVPQTAALDAAQVVADPGPGPEEQAVARSESARLRACLDDLPADRAQLVRRAYLDGDTYAELSAATGVKLNTIRTWLRRSLMALKECLRP